MNEYPTLENLEIILRGNVQGRKEIISNIISNAVKMGFIELSTGETQFQWTKTGKQKCIEYTYCIAQKAILKEADELYRKLNNLRDDYIEKNKPFNVGDKVKITTPQIMYPGGRIEKNVVRYAFVHGFKVNEVGKIIPELIEAKKDGKPSKNADFLSMHEIIKKEKKGHIPVG